MNLTRRADKLRVRLENFQQDEWTVPRILALYSAAVTLADDQLMTAAIHLALKHHVTRNQLHEIMLQSYLFLGFPRMLIAADCLSRVVPIQRSSDEPLAISCEDARVWSDRGVELCKRVYGRNYELLRGRVESMAPEIFQWMILEGYGKVLSRPGPDIVSRELSIVACLIMENRPSQLYSHVRGALNVGAPEKLLRAVVSDIGESAGEGYLTAVNVLDRLGIS